MSVEKIVGIVVPSCAVTRGLWVVWGPAWE